MSTYDREPNPEDFGPEPPHIANPFKWKENIRATPKEFLPRNDKPGKLTPIVLPNSSKFLRPKMQEQAK